MSATLTIEKIRKGSQLELEKIYRLYRSEFIGWIISKYSIETEDAREIYQQSVVIFYENIVNGQLTELTSSIKTYIFGIGKNLFMEQSRRLNKIDSYIQPEQLDDKWEIHNGAEEDINGYAVEMVEKSMGVLGSPCKQLLELFYYHKKSMETIKDILGYKNTDTVKNVKYKCLKRLRKIYLEAYQEQKGLAYEH